MAYGLARLTENVKRELTGILKDVRDYRVSGMIFSVTKVLLASDLSYAKVFVGVAAEPQEAGQLLEGLKSAAGFVRKELGDRLKMRRVPEVVFELDSSMEYSEKIKSKLNEIFKKTQNKQREEESGI